MTDFTQNTDIFSRLAQERLSGAVTELADDDRWKGKATRAAAVLVPIVSRLEGLTVLLTKRSDELPSHAGQVSFPGGKIDAGDGSPLAAALRETHEETGIEPAFVTPVGYLNTFATGTGFSVVPVVGLLSNGFELVPEPGEVSEIFEVPLAFLMNPANHQRRQGNWRGQVWEYHAIPYQNRDIWGATAGILVDLFQRMNGNG